MMAPTHKAIRVLSKTEGETVHRFTNRFNNGGVAILKGLDYIIVDEISMVKEIFFNIFTKIKRSGMNVKFIFTGDFCQLKPVGDRSTEFEYEDAHVMHELCDGNKMVLTKCRRADKEFFEMYTHADDVNANTLGKKKCERSVCYTNNKRKEINDHWMKKTIEENPKMEYTLIDAKKEYPLCQDIYAYVGLPLVCSYTCKRYDIANSEMFVVKELKFDSIVIASDDGELVKEIPFKDAVMMFYPAYCITVHKAQGSTFKHEFTIHEWDKMDGTMKYVAMSRGTCKKNVNIIE